MNCWNIHPIPQIWLPQTQTLPRWSVFFLNQEAIAAVKGYFEDLTKNHYRDGTMALEYRWNKCISLKGDYVEK
jgi:hypothetical protein